MRRSSNKVGVDHTFNFDPFVGQEEEVKERFPLRKRSSLPPLVIRNRSSVTPFDSFPDAQRTSTSCTNPDDGGEKSLVNPLDMFYCDTLKDKLEMPGSNSKPLKSILTSKPRSKSLVNSEKAILASSHKHNITSEKSKTELPDTSSNNDTHGTIISIILLSLGFEARLPNEFYSRLSEGLINEKKVRLRLSPRILTLVKNVLFGCDESTEEIRDEEMDELIQMWT